jgi:hypothetical protein
LAYDGQHLLPFHLKIDALKENQPTATGGILFPQIADLDQNVVRAVARHQAACGGFVCCGGQFHLLPLRSVINRDLSSFITNAPLNGRGFMKGCFMKHQCLCLFWLRAADGKGLELLCGDAPRAQYIAYF